jgi:starvation-inducible DNA-binding protein
MTTNTKTPDPAAIGIAVKDKTGITRSLGQLLADEHVLYIKMRNFHWNLTGPSFVEIHEFIEKLYNKTALEIDEVAERIQQLGYPSPGSMSEFLKLATLEEAPGGKKDQMAAVKELAADNDFMARNLRELIKGMGEKYDDPGTVDLLTKLIQSHEKSAWMLRRYLG